MRAPALRCVLPQPHSQPHRDDAGSGMCRGRLRHSARHLRLQRRWRARGAAHRAAGRALQRSRGRHTRAPHGDAPRGRHLHQRIPRPLPRDRRPPARVTHRGSARRARGHRLQRERRRALHGIGLPLRHDGRRGQCLRRGAQLHDDTHPRRHGTRSSTQCLPHGDGKHGGRGRELRGPGRRHRRLRQSDRECVGRPVTPAQGRRPLRHRSQHLHGPHRSQGPGVGRDPDA